MLRQKTLLVLGAGSSVDFKLPVGTDLAAQISAALSPENLKFGGIMDAYDAVDTSGLPLARVLMNQYSSKLGELRHAAAGISRDIGLAGSIDNYLGNNLGNELLIRIGKMAIVERILAAERRSGLFLKDGIEGVYTYPGSPRYASEFLSIGDGSWIETLLGVIMSGITPDGLADLFLNIRCMSFNYDRVFEQYLSHRLQQYWRLSDEDMVSLMQGLQVTRPYGRIGPLPWQEHDGEMPVEFGGSCSLKEASQAIRTYMEQQKESEFKPFQAQVDWAEQIIFLGFGFHQQNMVFLKQTLGLHNDRRAFGTVKDVSLPNQNAIKRLLMVAGVVPNDSYLSGCDCKSLIRDFQFEITATAT